MYCPFYTKFNDKVVPERPATEFPVKKELYEVTTLLETLLLAFLSNFSTSENKDTRDVVSHRYSRRTARTLWQYCVKESEYTYYLLQKLSF